MKARRTMPLPLTRALQLARRHGLSAALIAAAVLPATALDNGPVICPFRLITGCECPGCGISRAVAHALHGDFSSAMNFTRGVVIVLPLLLILAARMSLRQNDRRTETTAGVRRLSWTPSN
jgi:hypothetical protein